MGCSLACRQVPCLLQVLGLVEIKHQVTWQFYITRIMPIGLFMALTLYMGNVVYLYLTVSFIQMLKVLACSDTGDLRCIIVQTDVRRLQAHIA